MHPSAKRTSLEGLEIEVFYLDSSRATPAQWKKWLEVPLECSAAQSNLKLFNKLLEAGANGAAGSRGSGGDAPLGEVCVGGAEDTVPVLAGVGVQADERTASASSGRSALHAATPCGREVVIAESSPIAAEAADNFEDPVGSKRSVGR